MADVATAVPAEQIARLRLIRSENVGPVTFRQLINRFGTGRAALDALPDLARRGGRTSLRIATAAEAEAELARIERFGGRMLFWGLAPYPRLLAEIDDAPPVVAVRGDIRLLDRPTVAMVGARNASAAAIRFARGMAAELAAEGVVVVSGLARGIDAAAHTGALGGGTVGVIAGGLDVVYPPENAELHERLFAQGLVMAEQAMGVEPQARHFPRRNRIISGLSLGVVIVEAVQKSGSLITARFAGEQGREVMAVPGSPLDPRAQGCNMLIRDGATLVQSAADVLESIRPIAPRTPSPADAFRDEPATMDADDADRAAVTGLLSPVPVPVDELIRQSGLPAATVQTVLLELEIAGRLVRHAGGRVALSH
jgi:DNA processing protein